MKEKQNVKLDTVAYTHNPTTWKAEEESQIQKDKTKTKQNKKPKRGWVEWFSVLRYLPNT